MVSMMSGGGRQGFWDPSSAEDVMDGVYYHRGATQTARRFMGGWEEI